MGTETQDNWNKYFGNRKTPRFNSSRYVVIAIVLLLLSVIAYYNKDYITEVFRYGYGSSFDGLEMNSMVSNVNAVVEENKNYVVKFLDVYSKNNSYINSNEVINEWDLFINNSTNDLARINYHETYYEFMNSAKYLLYITEQFINDLNSHKLDYMSINTGVDKIQEQSNNVIDELVKAFDKNRIVYTKSGEGRITYHFKVK